MQSAPKIEIEGTCAPRFAFIRDLLSQEFACGRALGQAVALVVDGELVAHVWGGHEDGARRHQWRAGTKSCLFSASKPLCAVAVLKLVEDGRLRLDDRIVTHWPEFASGSKNATTVRHALAHLAGVPALDALPDGAAFDSRALASAMERQRPAWQPGQQLCFHSFTYGILCAELVRRTTGCSLGDFFRQCVADPLGLEIVFELDVDEQRHCADVELVPDNALFLMMTAPETDLGRSWRTMDWARLNDPVFREQGPASIAGHSSAVGLARYYAAMANEGRGERGTLLEAELVRTALTEQAHMRDPFMGAPVRMGLGHMLANDVFRFSGPTGFGQPGLGGVVGLGDRRHRLGLGIVCNRLAAGLENPFLDALLAAIAERL